MDQVMILSPHRPEASHTDKVVRVLKVARFVASVAMLAGVVAGTLGYGHDTKLLVAGFGGAVGVAAVILAKASHLIS